jgi:hypothetical protein
MMAIDKGERDTGPDHIKADFGSFLTGNARPSSATISLNHLESCGKLTRGEL